MDAGIRFILILIGALLLIAIIWDVVKKRQSTTKKDSIDDDSRSMPRSSTLRGHRDSFIEKDKAVEPTISLSKNFTESTDKPNSNRTQFKSSNLKQSISEAENLLDSITEKVSSTKETLEPPAPVKSISISIVARDKEGFVGLKLLDALQSIYVHFGRMNIFHRYKFSDGTGNHLFSLASAVEPGYFDLNKIKSQSFRGITLFFAVEQVKDPEESLDAMLKYAKQLSYRLDGHLLDRYHKPLTVNQIEDYKDSLQNIINAK